jgi:hypothetical protein
MFSWYSFIIIIIIIIIVAIEFAVGGISSYTNTDTTNKNKLYINETIQNTVQTIQKAINTSTHFAKAPTQFSK